jgi:hypothetical protein
VDLDDMTAPDRPRDAGRWDFAEHTVAPGPAGGAGSGGGAAAAWVAFALPWTDEPASMTRRRVVAATAVAEYAAMVDLASALSHGVSALRPPA